MTSEPVSGAERAVFGQDDADAVAGRLGRYLTRHLGTGIAEVLFRAGRIDAVWAVRTGDGRDVVVKAHRRPVDLAARRATTAAQRILAAAGFPCPTPISGPDEFDGLVLSAETLLAADGTVETGRRPGARRAMAAGLAEQVRLLRGHADLIAAAGRGPAWCRYHDGPWPAPHDTIFDFRVTPDGFGWLDDFAAAAAGRLTGARGGEVVAGHADWYGGNLRFDGDRLVAAYDWDLFADTEPVIAGMSAGSYTTVGGPDDRLPTPAEAAAFLRDYDGCRPRPFDAAERHVAAAAAAWVLAYNARCELGMLAPGTSSGPTLDLLRRHAREYLDLTW